jgi:type II secretory pathway component GspD/PulD (secretin)
MISNDGTKLVIGGIEKRSVVSVSGGVPILKDLPLIGWIFSTESESTKRSQLVVVAELLPVSKACNGQKIIKKVQKKVGNAGEKNTFGYRQYLIDSDR